MKYTAFCAERKKLRLCSMVQTIRQVYLLTKYIKSPRGSGTPVLHTGCPAAKGQGAIPPSAWRTRRHTRQWQTVPWQGPKSCNSIKDGSWQYSYIVYTSLVSLSLRLKFIPFVTIEHDQWYNEHNCQFCRKSTLNRCLWTKKSSYLAFPSCRSSEYISDRVLSPSAQ